MISTGFSWGDKPTERSMPPRPTPTMHNNNNNPRKRRQHEEESNRVHKPTTRKSFPIVQTKMNNINHKRLKTPKILGQQLPLNRVIEVLDKPALQELLQNLIKLHPEVSETVTKLAPKATLVDSLNLIKSKYDCIFNHLPYKCDVESDYSYLRIKPYLNEFFHCLSDFILNNLPPIESNSSNSLKFLDNITNLIHNLPNFVNNEFQYTKMMAYDQVVNCWLIILSRYNFEDSESSETNLISIINDLDLKNKLDQHNLLSQDKFKSVISFIDSEIENYEKVNHQLSGNSINDLITVDYSNYSITARTSH
ncbi:tethering factor for nuclear proteasome Sts1p [[Candida] anglica]|uniref:Tethering factor for nuclear proteasome STS1 n=1 Tax=[Candida] anglica TaxID=148631 RepID=A0ABP0EE59_9ASCO